MLEQLVEHHLSGMGFLATEALFNMTLLLENRLTLNKHKIPFPHDKEGSPLSGHTYPVMYAFGVMTSVAGHPVLQQLHQNHDSLAAWGFFGVAFAVSAVAVETGFGKIKYAPWKEVYEYIKKRVDWSFENGFLKYTSFLRKIPSTVAENSSCIWLLPAWAAFAATCAYIHDVYFKCKW